MFMCFYKIKHTAGFVPNYHNMRQARNATWYDEEAVGGEEGGPDLEVMEGEGHQGPSESQEAGRQHSTCIMRLSAFAAGRPAN